MTVALSAKALRKAYRDGERRVEVLKGVDLEVEEGEFVAIVGPSGSGKSTLLHLLGTLDVPDSGSIRIGDTEVSELDPMQIAAFRNERIGFVFQFQELLADFTALENVSLPGRIARWSPRRADERSRFLLQEVGLSDRMEFYPNELSGGERQRVALCRALLLQPPLLLADEPTGNLDTASSANVEQILKELAHRHDRAVVVVTHEARLAESADRIITLVDGRIHV